MALGGVFERFGKLVDKIKHSEASEMHAEASDFVHQTTEYVTLRSAAGDVRLPRSRLCESFGFFENLFASDSEELVDLQTFFSDFSF